MTVRIKFNRTKWAYRAIDHIKKHGGIYDPATKLWTVPDDYSADGWTFDDEIEIVP